MRVITNNLVIKTEELTNKDLINIKSRYGRGEVANLLCYPANMFLTKKVYCEDRLCGYAIIFLGFNGLNNELASLEEFNFWDLKEEDLTIFINDIINKETYPITITEIFYDDVNISEYHATILENFNISKKGLRR